VHRQPRAKNRFSCALSGGSPDSYCALSGVHRTGTVDCPVCPYRVLKKGLQPETEPEAPSSPPLPTISLCPWRFLPAAGDLPSPATTGDPTATSCPSPSLLGEQLWLPPSSPLLLSFSLFLWTVPPPCASNPKLVNSCEIQL
jgi:hypothetical protein